MGDKQREAAPSHCVPTAAKPPPAYLTVCFPAGPDRHSGVTVVRQCVQRLLWRGAGPSHARRSYSVASLGGGGGACARRASTSAVAAAPTPGADAARDSGCDAGAGAGAGAAAGCTTSAAGLSAEPHGRPASMRGRPDCPNGKTDRKGREATGWKGRAACSRPLQLPSAREAKELWCPAVPLAVRSRRRRAPAASELGTAGAVSTSTFPAASVPRAHEVAAHWCRHHALSVYRGLD